MVSPRNLGLGNLPTDRHLNLQRLVRLTQKKTTLFHRHLLDPLRPMGRRLLSQVAGHQTRRDEPRREDMHVALDSLRILLAPVIAKQRERVERAASAKQQMAAANGTREEEGTGDHIPLHGPRVRDYFGLDRVCAPASTRDGCGLIWICGIHLCARKLFYDIITVIQVAFLFLTSIFW